MFDLVIKRIIMSAGNIPFIEIPKEQLRHLDPKNFYFGKSFTNYMLEADYKDGAWTNAVIKNSNHYK